jgi:hypothetical protein
MLMRLERSGKDGEEGLLCHCTKYIRNQNSLDIQATVVPRRAPPNSSRLPRAKPYTATAAMCHDGGDNA